MLYNMGTNSDLSINDEEILKKLVSGDLKFHEIGVLLGEDVAEKLRLKALELKLKISCSSLFSSTLNPNICRANIENMIGSVQIPIGIAGPVKIKGQFAKGDFYLPLGTTEGTLTASVNRGCSIINKSGGAEVVLLQSNQKRSLLFKTDSIFKVSKFI